MFNYHHIFTKSLNLGQSRILDQIPQNEKQKKTNYLRSLVRAQKGDQVQLPLLSYGNKREHHLSHLPKRQAEVLLMPFKVLYPENPTSWSQCE